MPKEFTNCVKSGGKVVTKNLKNNKFIRICYDKNGNSFAGEVMKRKKKSKGFYKNNKVKKKVKQSKNLVDELQKLQEHWHDKFNMSKR